MNFFVLDNGSTSEDESGIATFYYKYADESSWSHFPGTITPPTNSEKSITFTNTKEGDFQFFALDHGDNASYQHTYHVSFSQPPDKATNPSPSSGATGRSINTDISWSNGGGATSYDVYFGTDSSPDSGEYKGAQSGTTYNPGMLSYSTTYYWRINAKNSDSTTTGDVWHFTTTAPTPTRIISLSGDMAFGNVTVGSSSQRTLTISNTGNSTLTVSGIIYPSGFSGSWNGTIPAGGSRNVTVTFSPSSATSYGGIITVNSDKTSGTNTISCSGTGTPVPIRIVSVNVTPDSASWSVSGPLGFEGNGQIYAGDSTFTDAPIGSYTWVGQALSEYSTPSSETKSLAGDGKISFEKTWTQQPQDATGWKYLRYDLSGSACTTERTTVATEANLISLFEINGVERNVLTGDVDGDGFIDIVTTSGSEIQIYAGDGTLKRSIPLPRESFATVLEDFDGDGVLDIGLGGGGTGFSAYICKGDGTLLKTFEGEHAGASTVSMSPLGMSKGKVLIEYNAGYALTPRGFASFDYETSVEDWYYQVGPAGGESSVTDIDDDSLLEITRSSYTTHNGASGNGTTDGDNYLVVVDETGQMKISQMYPSPTNGHARHLFVDFTNTGSWGILGFEGHDPNNYPGLARIHLYSNSGVTEHIFEGPADSEWIYAVGDLDGNGVKEVVASSGLTDTTTYVLDSTLTKINERIIPEQVKLLCDLTGDGNLEIVLLGDSGQLRIIDKDLNDIAAVQVGDRKGQVIASDINGDGIVELLCLTDKMYAFTFEASNVLGDVDGNEHLNLMDAILALQIAVGMDPSQDIYKAADANGDDKIGIEEAIYVLEKISGLRSGVWTDDFDDGNYTENLSWVVDNGNFIIEEGALAESEKGTDYSASIHTVINGNATSFQVDFVNPPQGLRGEHHMCFYLTDNLPLSSANGYMVVLYWDSVDWGEPTDYMDLIRIDNGVHTVIDSSALSPVNRDSFHHSIKLIVENGEVKAELDGVLKNSVSDTTYTEFNTISIDSYMKYYDIDARFDNVIITGLSSE